MSTTSISSKPYFLFFIGLIVFAIVLVFISANLNIRKKHKNVKRDFIKCPRWKPNDEKVENTQQVENLISEKLNIYHIFFDHEESSEKYQDHWTAINAVYDLKKEMWLPHPQKAHVDYTVMFFDKDQGGKILFRKTKQQKGELFFSKGDALCFSSGPEHEFLLSGNPILYHFRSKPFPFEDEYMAMRERSKILRDIE